jgi:hypothetical protein
MIIVPVMAEAEFVAAIREGKTAYKKLQASCVCATLDALNADYDAATDNETRIEIRGKFALLSETISRSCINEYVKNICQHQPTYKFNQAMIDLCVPCLDRLILYDALNLAIRTLQWPAIRAFLVPVGTRFHGIHLDNFTISSDDFQCLIDIIRLIADNLRDVSISVTLPTNIAIPLSHLWTLHGRQRIHDLKPYIARHGITNDRIIHHNVYRVHVERLVALMACVSDDYLWAPESGRFWHIVKRLPRDLQEVLANRCYDCVRDIVVMRRGIYWALMLGDCHKYAIEEEVLI